MIGLLQRVSRAHVDVAGQRIAEIGAGLLVLVGVQADDSAARAERLLQRVLGYRMFADAQGRMNLSLADCGGGLLLVPQFTLAADTRQGMRASFSAAAEPMLARQLFDHLVAQARRSHGPVACGHFGADMQVTLTNDGPVTFRLQA
ncbi:D-aminoacyl-tRNA deacylase [Panacagrimonas sp.]|uniref:D-aminoacyl-tRNA deacylase n=1 Tax=Panacagrimonas sp. TaxID=2480088 RepID=UPI003B529928